MKLLPVIFLVSNAILLSSPAHAGVTFGPVQGKAGDSIKLLTHSETSGGTIQRLAEDQTTISPISITRDRELIWTYRDPGPDTSLRGWFRVLKITTISEAEMDGRKERSVQNSPLTGLNLDASKTPNGDWEFKVDGQHPPINLQADLEELKAYLQRKWYPDREVNVGDVWEFNPAWIKLIIEKDLSRSNTVAKMKFREIRNTVKGQMAVLDITIASSGGDIKRNGNNAAAIVTLEGQVMVNLETMLDEHLELKGTIITGASSDGGSLTVTLPIQLKATKSFVKE